MTEDHEERRLTRRRTLSLSAGALAVGLAGCSDVGLGGEGGEEGEGGGEGGEGGENGGGGGEGGEQEGGEGGEDGGGEED